MSENRYGLYADCIRTIILEPTTVETFDNITVTGNAVVDGSTLIVDSINNRVGINTLTPTTALDVAGVIKGTSLTGTLNTAAQPNITSFGTLASALNLGGNNITNVGTLAGTLTTAHQPNVTRLGTQTADLNMGGFNISNVGSIAGTMTTPAQSLITSLGNLSGLVVDGIARLNDSLYLGAYVANVMNKGIFFRASSGSTFQENGSNAFNLSITTWDQTTLNATPDSMSFNAFDGFRWVTNSTNSATTVPMSITGAGVTTISTLNVTNTLTNKQTAKAFINFNGNTSTINNSFNVSSITRNSTGTYTITFTNAMLNTTYAWFATAGFDNFDQSNYVSSPQNTAISTWKTTTSLRIRAYYGNNLTNVDPTDVNVIIFS